MMIAVTSKDGISVDQHFGHAERFIIYEVNSALPAKVGEREVSRYCTYDPEHPLRTYVLEAILDVLSDCRVVVTAKIGDAPREFLETKGFDIYEIAGPIEEALSGIAMLYE